MSPPSRCDETTVPIREAHLLAVLEPSAPEEWPTFDQVMTAFEATVGTFDEKFVTEKVQVLYEAAVLEAEGKDTEDQVDRLRLLLQQIVSLIGRPSSSSSSSSGATVEVAGASVGAAQRAQAALHHSEQSGTIGIAFCCEAFSAGWRPLAAVSCLVQTIGVADVWTIRLRNLAAANGSTDRLSLRVSSRLPFDIFARRTLPSWIFIIGG